MATRRHDLAVVTTASSKFKHLGRFQSTGQKDLAASGPDLRVGGTPFEKGTLIITQAAAVKNSQGALSIPILDKLYEATPCNGDVVVDLDLPWHVQQIDVDLGFIRPREGWQEPQSKRP